AIHCWKASHLMASNPLSEDNPRKPRLVGKPVGQEIVILDENGVQQEANVNGQWWIYVFKSGWWWSS
ncbi:oxalate-- ligase-like, partial [Olea europaea subsp. europaea]